jgi:ferredoxin
MQPARPANRPRPNANPASLGGAPAKVESRALFILPNIYSGQAITLGDGGVPNFDREKCVHCGACIWNCAQPLPDNPERTNIAFRAGTGGLHSAEN